MKNKGLKIMFLLACILWVSCNDKPAEINDETKDTFPKHLFATENPNIPNLFLKNWVCTHHHEQNLSISPNYKYALYSQGTPYQDFYTIMLLEKNNMGWSAPTIAPFSGQYADFDPFISVDGSKLFFVSRRPTHEKDTIFDSNIWMVKRLDNHWGKPKLLGNKINSADDEYYVSVAENGNLYFTSTKAGGFGKWNIYFSKFENEDYQEAQLLEPTINSKQKNWDPYISVDERFLIFTSEGHGRQEGGDLYISYKNNDGEWGLPENLGEKINTPGFEYCPNYSPDGQWFFFSRFANLSHSLQLEKPRATEEWNKFLNSPETGLGDIYYISSEMVLNN